MLCPLELTEVSDFLQEACRFNKRTSRSWAAVSDWGESSSLITTQFMLSLRLSDKVAPVKEFATQVDGSHVPAADYPGHGH